MKHTLHDHKSTIVESYSFVCYWHLVANLGHLMASHCLLTAGSNVWTFQPRLNGIIIFICMMTDLSMYFDNQAFNVPHSSYKWKTYKLNSVLLNVPALCWMLWFVGILELGGELPWWVHYAVPETPSRHGRWETWGGLLGGSDVQAFDLK